MPTTNPVPSTDPSDLLFNAGKLDEVVNGASASYTDRLGVSRRSLSGIDAAADNVLNSIGYSVPVAYASGISLTLTSQTVDYNGVVYAPKSSALPFTTSSWGIDSAKFRAVQVTDANLITYTPAGTGAVATTVQSKLRETVSVKDFKCDDGLPVQGDGVHDDTTGIQAALTATRLQGGSSKKLYWDKGTYEITEQLICGTNQYVEFDPGVTVNLVPASNVENTSLFVSSNQSNVTFIGNGATINGTKVGAVIEGRAAAFNIYGSDNVLIQNFNVNNMATDGITITGDATGSGPCINVTVQDCVVTGCRRNGMSIISAIGMRVIGGIYQNSAGAPNGPWAGIDIEPNENCFLEDVTLIGVITNQNGGSGIQVTPGALSVPGAKRFHVNIIGGRSIFDGGANAGAGMWFTNGGTQTKKVFGEVNVFGFTVESPVGRGVDFRNWDADKCPRVMLENMTVYNPGSTGTATTNLARTAYVVHADSTQATANIGNIVMRNCHAEDVRETAVMTWGYYIGADSGKSLKNIRIEDPSAINYISTLKAEVNVEAASTTNGMIDVDVIYKTPKILSAAGGGISSVVGKRITPSSSSRSFSLPNAENCIGAHYEFQNGANINSTTIQAQSGDTIMWYGANASTNIVLDAGGYVSLRSIGANTWLVEALSGAWRRFGQTFKKQVEYGTANPTSGTWVAGDRVFNGAPAVGQPKSWVCTVGGTPGTWVSEGNL